MMGPHPKPKQTIITVTGSPMRVQTSKEKLAGDRAEIENMNDGDLAFEEVSLNENIENIQLELRLWNEGQSERPDRWNIGAEHAISKLKARRALVKLELARRKKYDDEQQVAQRRVEAEQRQAAHLQAMQTLQNRKRENIEAADKAYRDQSRAFVRHAETMLPRETFKAIWAAVEAEKGKSN